MEEELQNCMTYFKIQQYRFGDRLQLSVECDPEEKAAIYSCRIPKLTLQPILEIVSFMGQSANWERDISGSYWK